MTRADWLLIIAVLAGLPWLYATFWSAGPGGQQLHILANSSTDRVTPLDGNQVLHIAGTLGDSVIQVEHGRARFLQSPCANKVCINQGWVTTAGALAACLPNRVSIQVLGRESRFDAINF